jgi:hypothetical protein
MTYAVRSRPWWAQTTFLGVNMANRDAPRGLFRYGVGVLILIVIALIVYALARGAATPGPRAVVDSTVVPKVRP